MNYWIFTVTGQRFGKEVYTSKDIFPQRMEDQFWGIGDKSPNRKNLSKGDKVIFYIGLPDKVFGGEATLVTPSFQLAEEQKRKFAHEKQVYTTEYGVFLEGINIWDKPKLVEDLIPDLSFIDNKEFWFAYFQGGVRQITESDYRTIIGGRESSLIEQITTSKDIESQTEFALESHLEEFLYQNWRSIDWGENLVLYQTVDQDGRQFPAGTWSIDFLAKDTKNDDLVVIELKEGKNQRCYSRTNPKIHKLGQRKYR